MTNTYDRQMRRLAAAWDRLDESEHWRSESRRLRAELRAWKRALAVVTCLMAAYLAWCVWAVASERRAAERIDAEQTVRDITALRADLAPVVALAQGITRMMDGRGAVRFDRAAN